eukprot:717553_1
MKAHRILIALTICYIHILGDLCSASDLVSRKCVAYKPDRFSCFWRMCANFILKDKTFSYPLVGQFSLPKETKQTVEFATLKLLEDKFAKDTKLTEVEVFYKRKLMHRVTFTDGVDGVNRKFMIRKASEMLPTKLKVMCEYLGSTPPNSVEYSVVMEDSAPEKKSDQNDTSHDERSNRDDQEVGGLQTDTELAPVEVGSGNVEYIHDEKSHISGVLDLSGEGQETGSIDISPNEQERPQRENDGIKQKDQGIRGDLLNTNVVQKVVDPKTGSSKLKESAPKDGGVGNADKEKSVICKGKCNGLIDNSNDSALKKNCDEESDGEKTVNEENDDDCSDNAENDGEKTYAIT